jgi:ubiquinone/menaquinone biosynthesis C-methylase UbiE
MFDHFGLLAPIYDRVIQPNPPVRLTQLLDLQPGLSVLDVGGGTGRVSQFFIDQVGQVIVADLSLKMLLKSLTKPGLVPINSHSENLPFPDESFDRIVMVDALHHVCDQKRTAQELWRVVKPGGKIVIEEPNINLGAVKLVALAEKIALMRSHFLTGEQIQGLFNSLSSGSKLVFEDHFVWFAVEKS